MIDICQWRASIGSWYCRQLSYRTHCTKKSHTSDVTTDNSRIDGVSRVRWIRGLTFSLVCGLLLLLILSGDVEPNPGPITGNTKHHMNDIVLMYTIYTGDHRSKELLQTHFDKLVNAITPTLYSVTNALFANKLIPFETSDDILTIPGEGDFKKASKLLIALQRQLQTHSNPDQYLHDICHVLRNQQHQTLTDIATSILKQLGQSSLHEQHSLLLLSFIPIQVILSLIKLRPLVHWILMYKNIVIL